MGIDDDLGESEVENFGVAALSNKDVGGLDVAMHNTFGVGGIERIRNLDSEGQQDIQFHRAPGDTMF